MRSRERDRTDQRHANGHGQSADAATQECRSVHHKGDRFLPAHSEHFMPRQRKGKNGQPARVTLDRFCRKCKWREELDRRRRRRQRIDARVQQLVDLDTQGKLPKCLIPHTAEVAEALNRHFGGPEGIAEAYRLTLDAAMTEGNWTLTERILANTVKYIHDVSEAGHADKPDHLKTREEAGAEILEDLPALKKYLEEHGHTIVMIERPATLAIDVVKSVDDIEASSLIENAARSEAMREPV
jgi:hypothetical protein